MQVQGHATGTITLAASQGVGRSLTVADVWLCIVPIGLFLSIISLV